MEGSVMVEENSSLQGVLPPHEDTRETGWEEVGGRENRELKPVGVFKAPWAGCVGVLFSAHM